MTKTVAYMALHYGAEWMSWAIRSVREAVDEVIVVYSQYPSYGHSTPYQCPESPEQLRYLAVKAGAIFYDVSRRFSNEGQHRKVALEYCRYNHAADVVVVLDSDEVWGTTDLKIWLESIKQASAPKRNWRLPVRHFWRSVNWVCYDPAMPVRIIDLNVPNESDGYISNGKYINHFGYAQSEEIVRYKWRIHGHLPELRPGWLEDKFLAWEPGMTDVHPTCANGFWNPQPFDRREIGHLIGDHPYFTQELIR